MNTYTMDFAAPFGGYKASGIGREFGPEGLAQYTELKSIYTEAPAGLSEQLNELAYYAVTHHPADARKVFPEATDAEALGLGSCMISERFTVKEAGALAGAVGRPGALARHRQRRDQPPRPAPDRHRHPRLDTARDDRGPLRHVVRSGHGRALEGHRAARGHRGGAA